MELMTIWPPHMNNNSDTTTIRRLWHAQVWVWISDSGACLQTSNHIACRWTWRRASVSSTSQEVDLAQVSQDAWAFFW